LVGVSEVAALGLSKSFGATRVLDNLSLRVPSGSLTVILGPSGCGKTTLLRLIAGFERPDRGTITIDGQTVCDERTSLPPERRQIGYVAQEGALFPHLDVAANITFGLPFRERRERGRVAELLELVGLDPALARRQPHELSGGQQQRVALARALAPRPRVVLLDEPFSALDAALREGTRRAVADALARAGATAILVTHDQAEALSLATQVAILRDGTLAQVGTPAELYAAPADLAVAVFLGDAVILPATVRGGVAECALGPVPTRGRAADGPAQILLRPEQLLVDAANVAGAATAQVIECTYFGKDVTVRLALHPSGTALVARVPGHAAPEVGAHVGLTVRGEAVVYPA
jgi:iron(III) transport system ATP-binding protein